MAEKKESTEKAKLAVVRIRGSINLTHRIKRTFELLNLHRQNYCIVLDNTPTNIGMVNKVKDFVTWGEINEETLSKLKSQRGKSYINRDGKKTQKKFFRLQPPVKGFGRKGIKRQFSTGGALGYRGDKINDLIMRML